jgi:hypothetical protein
MKIVIEAETEEEKKQFPELKTFDKVFEFALTGRLVKDGIAEISFSHLHLQDSSVLCGRLFELIERLRLMGIRNEFYSHFNKSN